MTKIKFRLQLSGRAQSRPQFLAIWKLNNLSTALEETSFYLLSFLFSFELHKLYCDD
jgi:hypothetical protein